MEYTYQRDKMGGGKVRKEEVERRRTWRERETSEDFFIARFSMS